MSDQTEETPVRKPFVDLRDVLGVIGAGSLSYGCWLIYQPAAFIVAGVIFLAAAILSARA